MAEKKAEIVTVSELIQLLELGRVKKEDKVVAYVGKEKES